MKSLTLKMILTGALIALPAFAETTKAPAGFAAYDLDAAAQAAKADPALVEARLNLAHTETLRAGFVLAPDRGWQLLTEQEARGLHIALGGKRANGDAALQWFMQGAVASAASDGMTGLYNPIADVWLALDWQTIAGTPRIRQAAFVPGELVREGSDKTPWTQKEGSYMDALAAQTVASKAGFVTLRAAPFFNAMAPLRPVLSDQSFASVERWIKSTQTLSDKAHRTQWKTLHARLAQGDDKGPASSLPAQVRATMVPAGVIVRDDGTSMLLVSPLAPQMVVGADIGRAQNISLNLINLANGRAPNGEHTALGGDQ